MLLVVDPFAVGSPQQPPGHLRDAIRELRDYTSDVVASRRTRDVWELARHLFTDAVCRALKINKPRPYDPRDDGRFGKDHNLERSRRDLIPQPGRRNEPEPGPSKPVSRKDLLLDEADQRELEELEKAERRRQEIYKKY